ncbi:glycosyltransferase family A protein [Bacillus suaedaesalsae]|uniref:Glycosyltransferase family 2 protein n=1 Tax=Bacillus suaedaesalsae TaxID=2810349 RepID=A0ABS2DKS9_9BACI|nr:glycosyltransferase family A protein [Bacillus suaedaesalsae]MBM6619100.1 glycosyltransferase family 2 protein [Bacillus suaedaesalsae]
MNLEVLVSTMNQTDYNLLEKMNIQSDAIIINQCKTNRVEKFNFKGNTIKMFSFDEKGVGLSRNNALMRTTAEIALFADEDVTYVDNYKEIVINGFKSNPDADMLIFNVPSKNQERPLHFINKERRVRLYNCLKYGAVSIAIKTERLKKKNIYFSLLFGGGARYSAGEDSLFISDCLKKGLKIYTNPNVIGYVSQENSSWFEGYTEKYFFDKGAFFASFSRRGAILFCLQYAFRHRSTYKGVYSNIQIIRLMLNGIKHYNRQN